MFIFRGSSLKGAIRSHCERIVRTLGSGLQSNDAVWACDPLKDRPPDARDLSCSKKLDEENKKRKRQRQQELTGSECYASSCTACQLFGNTVLASHFRIADAYPVDLAGVRREERNGVAIDRSYGSVAEGPFNFEVLTDGKFTTTITVKISQPDNLHSSRLLSVILTNSALVSASQNLAD